VEAVGPVDDTAADPVPVDGPVTAEIAEVKRADERNPTIGDDRLAGLRRAAPSGRRPRRFSL
jgi:hypothetical protein